MKALKEACCVALLVANHVGIGCQKSRMNYWAVIHRAVAPRDVLCNVNTEKLKDRREMGLKPTFSCSMKLYGVA
jgi:hypothetical protein